MQHITVMMSSNCDFSDQYKKWRMEPWMYSVLPRLQSNSIWVTSTSTVEATSDHEPRSRDRVSRHSTPSRCWRSEGKLQL